LGWRRMEVVDVRRWWMMGWRWWVLGGGCWD